MSKWKIASTLAACALLLNLAGCSDDDGKGNPPGGGGGGGHSSPLPDCDAIIKVCHDVDVGEGEIHDCHDVGHGAKSEAECTSIKDHCLQICTAAAADAGGHDDGG